MKKLLNTLVAFAILCVMAIAFQACSNEKYTVWTETESYSQFVSESGTTIEDGHYVRADITEENWQQIMVPALTNEGKHRWSEAEIKKWLIGCGFGEFEATQQSSWLVMTNHGVLFARDNNVVHMIVK